MRSIPFPGCRRPRTSRRCGKRQACRSRTSSTGCCRPPWPAAPACADATGRRHRPLDPGDAAAPPGFSGGSRRRLPLARRDLLLLAVNDGLEVGAGPELGHRRLGHLDSRARGRVPCGARWPIRLLEDAESGNSYLVAFGYCVLDGVKNCVYGFSCGFLIPQLPGNSIDQVALVHVVTPAVPPTGGRVIQDLSYRSQRPLTCPKLGDVTAAHNDLRKETGRVVTETMCNSVINGVSLHADFAVRAQHRP